MRNETCTFASLVHILCVCFCDPVTRVSVTDALQCFVGYAFSVKNNIKFDYAKQI
jgi:hypothetical protein